MTALGRFWTLESLRPGKQERQQFRPALPVDNAIDEIGPEAAFETHPSVQTRIEAVDRQPDAVNAPSRPAQGRPQQQQRHARRPHVGGGGNGAHNGARAKQPQKRSGGHRLSRPA